MCSLIMSNYSINDIDNVIKMFNKNKINVKSCVEYEKRIKKSKAFVVTIKANDKDKVYSPNLWPVDVVLSKYSVYIENKGNNNKQNTQYSNKKFNSTFSDDN